MHAERGECGKWVERERKRAGCGCNLGTWRGEGRRSFGSAKTFQLFQLQVMMEIE